MESGAHSEEFVWLKMALTLGKERRGAGELD